MCFIPAPKEDRKGDALVANLDATGLRGEGWQRRQASPYGTSPSSAATSGCGSWGVCLLSQKWWCFRMHPCVSEYFVNKR